MHFAACLYNLFKITFGFNQKARRLNKIVWVFSFLCSKHAEHNAQKRLLIRNARFCKRRATTVTFVIIHVYATSMLAIALPIGLRRLISTCISPASLMSVVELLERLHSAAAFFACFFSVVTKSRCLSRRRKHEFVNAEVSIRDTCTTLAQLATSLISAELQSSTIDSLHHCLSPISNPASMLLPHIWHRIFLGKPKH